MRSRYELYKGIVNGTIRLYRIPTATSAMSSEGPNLFWGTGARSQTKQPYTFNLARLRVRGYRIE
jgi:hypothetical protein